MKKILQGMIGYAIGLACLFWLFHKLPLEQFMAALRHVNGWGLLPGAGLSLLAYLCVAWEWQFLLRPVGQFPYKQSVLAVFAGRFANDVLPLHAGYLVRIFLASRWMNRSMLQLAPSLMMERLWDGIWLALGTGALSLIVHLPAGVVEARNALAVAVGGGIVATAAVVLLRRNSVNNTPRKGFLARTTAFIHSVAGGMRDIVQCGTFFAVLLTSLLKLALQAAAILVILPACGIRISMADGLGVFVAGYLATCVPATPAGAGLFQVFVVEFLIFLGVDKPTAAGFSIISFVVVAFPPALAGFAALAKTGFSLRKIQAEFRGQK